MQHQSSCRQGMTAIVLGCVRTLAALLTICLYWHEGDVCVIVRVCLLAFAYSRGLIIAVLCVVCVVRFVRCVLVESFYVYTYSTLRRASFHVFWVMMLFLFVCHL